MTARYPSFISATDSKSDAPPLPFSGSCAVNHTPIEEPARCPSSVVHQQAPLQLYDPINYDSATHGNQVFINLDDMIRGRRYSVLGFSTDGSTNPDLLTNSDNYFNTTWNDRSIIPPASSQGVLPLPPGALASAHDQINEISPYNQYIPSFAYSEPSNPQFQPNIAHTLGIPPDFRANWFEFHSIPPAFQPGTHQISPRTDANASALCGPHYPSLSTPDGSMGVPVLSSGPSPSFSQHHRTPSSASSFILNTPDENPRHLENCYQVSPNTVNHTSSHQRSAGALAPCQVAQNTLHQSALETKQPKVAPNNTLKVPLYKRIAPVRSDYVKPLKDSPSRRKPRQARKETPRTSLPPGTVVFKDGLTPTNIGEDSFNTSSRKHDERIIARIGVNAEAGYSIAPQVQAKLCGGSAPTHTPIHGAKRTPATGPSHSWQRRDSKGAQGGGRKSAPRRTSDRSPPTKPQNPTSQNAGTLPPLGKRQKRHTTDSNSSSNSSKTPTGRSRTNSHEDQKPTPLSSQQKIDSSYGSTRSFRKNSDQISCEEVGATSSPSGSLSRIPVLSGGRSKPVGRALALPRTGPPQGRSMSYRDGPAHGAGYQTGLEAVAARTQELAMNGNRTQQQLPTMITQGGGMDPPVVDRENLMSTQTLLETGNFIVERDADRSYNSNVARFGYAA